jgi:hypothetical protein
VEISENPIDEEAAEEDDIGSLYQTSAKMIATNNNQL